jgi:sigma-B regulation protein RsbU (phosphoserine phosphatase)
MRGGTAQLLPTVPEIAAGIMAGLAANSHSAQIEPDDLVVFYTDGVTEAFNAAGDLFGDARLLESLARESGHGAADTAAALLHSVREHADGYPQSDDIAILALKRKGAVAVIPPMHQRLTP